MAQDLLYGYCLLFCLCGMCYLPTLEASRGAHYRTTALSHFSLAKYWGWVPPTNHVEICN